MANKLANYSMRVLIVFAPPGGLGKSDRRPLQNKKTPPKSLWHKDLRRMTKPSFDVSPYGVCLCETLRKCKETFRLQAKEYSV